MIDGWMIDGFLTHALTHSCSRSPFLPPSLPSLLPNQAHRLSPRQESEEATTTPTDLLTTTPFLQPPTQERDCYQTHHHYHHDQSYYVFDPPPPPVGRRCRCRRRGSRRPDPGGRAFRLVSGLGRAELQCRVPRRRQLVALYLRLGDPTRTRDRC
jgi:hypothetical protein